MLAWWQKPSASTKPTASPCRQAYAWRSVFKIQAKVASLLTDITLSTSFMDEQLMQGFSLIELIVLIVVVGIITTGITTSYMTSLRNSGRPHEIEVAAQLAQERMEIIIAQKRLKGFSSTADLCPGPSVCTLPSGYTIPAPVISANYLGDSNYKQLTVTVNGPNNLAVTLDSLVADF